jgi:hypothetical protein
MEEWQRYYATQSIVTDPGVYKELLSDLPDDIPSLCRAIQGLFLHRWWTEQYCVNISEAQKEEIKIRKLTRQLKRILELEDSPLTTARRPDRRLVGTCRDYAAVLTSFLRHKGISARMRVGFATYLNPGQYIDHYLCQYWNAAQKQWLLVDSQIDDLQRRTMHITFDTCNVAEDLFVTAGKAWQLSREGKVDPDLFGIFEVRGLWFIGCDMVLDTMSLNKIESHPFDIWPLMPSYGQKDYSKEYLNVMDTIAAITGTFVPDFAKVRSLYQSDKKLQPPLGWEP